MRYWWYCILLSVLPLGIRAQQNIELCSDDRVVYNYFTATTGPGNFYWLIDDHLYDSGENNTTIDWSSFASGVHTLELGYSNTWGCYATPQLYTINLINCSENAVYLPNSFTPDNDGINDVWYPEILNPKHVYLVIYNRWGEMVFESTEKHPVWIGNHRNGGYFVPDDAYVYRIEIEFESGEKKDFTGHVVVVR